MSMATNHGYAECDHTDVEVFSKNLDASPIDCRKLKLVLSKTTDTIEWDIVLPVLFQLS